MNAIVIHSADGPLQRVSRRGLQRRTMGRAPLATGTERTAPTDTDPTAGATRRRVHVHRRPAEEPFQPPRDTGDPRTQLYAEHENLPPAWASWQFVNYLI
jgi:hypothetical protein